MREIGEPQPFCETHIDYNPEPNMMGNIIAWARDLPVSSAGILDAAAGYGVDIQELRQLGIQCIGQDASDYMVKHSCTDLQVGVAENLSRFSDNIFGGILLKHAWVFLSPEQRRSMLFHAHRVLVPGGSMLVISEFASRYVVLYHAKNTTVDHSLNYQNKDYNEWKTTVKALSQTQEMVLYSYRSAPGDIQSSAKKLGFDFSLLGKFTQNNSLARESRWVRIRGFIAKLTSRV